MMLTMKATRISISVLIILHLSIDGLIYDSFNSNEEFEEDEKLDVFDSYENLTPLEKYPEVCEDYADEYCAKKWLDTVQDIYSRNSNRLSNIHFQYQSNITNENRRLMKKFQFTAIKLNRKLKEKILKFQWQDYKDPDVLRTFKINSGNIMSKNVSLSLEIAKINREISTIYNSAKPKVRGKSLAAGEFGIQNLFKTEKDYDVLAEAWAAWRDETGSRIRDLYVRRMDLMNAGAHENGYSDIMQFRLENDFEQKNFGAVAETLMEEIHSFYEQLHGFVRNCLWLRSGRRFDRNGPIPAHLLGNVWAQQWTEILPDVLKCMHTADSLDDDSNSSSADSSNLSPNEQAGRLLQDFTVHQMFKKAEDFFVSMGMFQMTPEFWERSMLEKPRDGRLVDCHGSAHDLSNGVDFRIKMCTQTNLNDFTTVHHEMGHIQYYMAYADKPVFLHGSANSGFHEAVGDTIALSVKSSTHLAKVGLTQTSSARPSRRQQKKDQLQALMAVALEKVVFLPFALTVESFTWAAYNGSVDRNHLNAKWWSLRNRIQGLRAPVPRSEEDFDPGAKYHMAKDIGYIRYFVSFIVQFQMYESLCKLSGYQETDPLHQCDFYGSHAAGSHLLRMLSLGQSRPWPQALHLLTGSDHIHSTAMLRYFQPLDQWLKATNSRMGIPVGW